METKNTIVSLILNDREETCYALPEIYANKEKMDSSMVECISIEETVAREFCVHLQGRETAIFVPYHSVLLTVWKV